MPNAISKAELDITDKKSIRIGILKIVPANISELNRNFSLVEASDEEMEIWSEERIQLLENCRYEYIIQSDQTLQLKKVARIVSPSVLSNSTGIIEPHSNVGLLVLQIENDRNEIVSEIGVEVRSAKLEYRDQYRKMLEDIAERCTDLIVQIQAPLQGLFKPNVNENSKVLGQRFSFLKHLLTTKEFKSWFREF